MDLHYAWIGAPPDDRARDVNDPKLMSQRIPAGSIYFWCLDEHVAAYRATFTGYNNVTVRGMESFLGTAASFTYRWWYWYGKKDDWAVSGMTNILAWGKHADTPRAYRAFVKDAFYLFLLYTWGGYVLDAGVGPHGGVPALADPTTLVAPALTADDALAMTRVRMAGNAVVQDFDMTINGGVYEAFREALDIELAVTNEGETVRQLEVWMLASPRYGAGAWAALRQYLYVWGRMQERGVLVNDAAPNVFRYLVAGSVYNGLTVAGAPVPNGSFWRCQNIDGGGVSVPDLRVRKVYHGSSAR
jgi:hypothetical protein